MFLLLELSRKKIEMQAIREEAGWDPGLTHALFYQEVTAVVIAAAEDITAQQLVSRWTHLHPPAGLRNTLPHPKWGIERTLMFAVFGGFYTGAVQLVWFGMLNSPAVSLLLPVVGSGVVSKALALNPQPSNLKPQTWTLNPNPEP